jgi:hypothetical protein
MWVENLFWILAVILIIGLSNYCTHMFGKAFYKKEENKDVKIFDLLWHITPDLHNYSIINDIIPVVLFIVFTLSTGSGILLKEFFGKFLLILLVRALTIVSTILPKHEKCDDNLKWYDYIKGQCYDKVFSGHMSFVLLLCLIMLRENIISVPTFFAINATQFASIILTRSHYTVDVILGLVITYLVYDGDYHILQDFAKRLGKNL